MNKAHFQEGESITAQRAACGYRIQLSCANCRNCVRGWVAAGTISGSCTIHEFPVNLDRGICRDFDNIAKH